jgi:hypothetical protein
LVGIDPLEITMEKFIHRQNLEHYRKLLPETTDEVKLQTIRKLLAEEEAKDRLSPEIPPSSN